MIAIFFILYGLLFIGLSTLNDLNANLLLFAVIFSAINIIYIFIIRSTKVEKIGKIVPVALLGIVGLTLISLYPTLSNDIYRYLWDGMLLGNGVDPYFVRPDDISLVRFSSTDLYRLIDWKDQFTLYPPLAQYIFVLAYALYANVGLFASKILFALPIFLLLYFLRSRLSNKLWILLMLNPLLLLEIFYGSHVDSFILLFLTLSYVLFGGKKSILSGVFLAFAFMIKLYPIIFLPLYLKNAYKKGGWRESAKYLTMFVTTVAIVYLPLYTNPLSHIFRLMDWAKFMDFNSSIFRYSYTLVEIFRDSGREQAQLGVLILLIVSIAFFASRRFSVNTFIALGLVFLFLSPVVFPWYSLFLIPFIFLSQMKGERLLIKMVVMQMLLVFTYLNPIYKSNFLFDRYIDLEYIVLLVFIYHYFYQFQIPRILPISATKMLKNI